MSLKELEKLKFDWDFVIAGGNTTRCCATGTCCINVSKQKLKAPKISIMKDSRNPHSIKQQYGILRNPF